MSDKRRAMTECDPLATFTVRNPPLGDVESLPLFGEFERLTRSLLEPYRCPAAASHGPGASVTSQPGLR